jgi:hypothetical protein
MDGSETSPSRSGGTQSQHDVASRWLLEIGGTTLQWPNIDKIYVNGGGVRRQTHQQGSRVAGATGAGRVVVSNLP